ncbi:MAG: DUF5906 domain-containing protein [Alphaproteobacteria bacterium]|nr:DUF5906 domain-containing protein [Alphaproteobacteria bacterium]
MDFIKVHTRETKNNSKNREAGSTEVFIDFRVFNSKDLMTRGHSFYAVYDSNKKLWSRDEMDVVQLVDTEIMKVVNKQPADKPVVYGLMENYQTGNWQKYTSYIKNMPDNWSPLDDHIHFANDELSRESHATRRLPYARKKGPIENYDKLMSVLYAPKERDKLEWAVGAILTGDSKHIQKFITLYGSAGSGKSTFLNVVQKLVEGYYISFNAKDLVGHDAFGAEVFKTNPLVAIQHDGDLSRIEDNSTLNSIISHEDIVINEKHKSKYSMRINCFLFLGTNKPVAISDTKSGLLRRLIDVHPSGDKIPKTEYTKLVKNIDFELGAIADYCITKYKKMGEDYYQNYQPKEMMFETNTLYNFVFENFLVFENGDYFQLRQIYDMYKRYCEDSGEQYPLKKRVFRAEMKAYFANFYDVARTDDGKQVRSVYRDFKGDIFNVGQKNKEENEEKSQDVSWLHMDKTESLFDEAFKDSPAQLANAAGTPEHRWVNCTTTLKDIDTSKLHYVAGLGEDHIIIDFDLSDSNGEKSLAKNLEAANKWPKTYAELSKSGAGIHLHYLWGGGRTTELKKAYAPGIEVLTFTGNWSLRRKLTWCNTEPIATLTSGLVYDEKKGGSKVLNKKNVEDEKHLRIMIKKCMNKEFHGSTKPEMDFIYKLLDEAYSSGMVYDVSDMRSSVLTFAASSTHQATYCIDLMSKMKWASEPLEIGPTNQSTATDDDLVFYDVEVFKNFFLICYKLRGKDKKVVSLVNPTPQQVGRLFESKLIGFNNKRYDDHMLYGRYIGYSNEQLYDLSQKIISKEGSVRNGFREAYSIAYSDVYDFCREKKSLKKWEIELGLHHQELEFDFNEPLPEEHWDKAIEYCANDVIATEGVFDHNQSDWVARKILADLADGTPNMTTNQLTTKIVFGNDRKPQLEYTNLEETFPGYEFVRGEDNKMHNMYRGTDVGMGGYVYAEPGMYFDVALIDIQSMHPNSIINMNYFGEYTQRYAALKDARVAIKEKDFELARTMLDGKLIPYLTDESLAEGLADALKLALNSAYGLTSASFENAMKDSRNKNNIVALRGALFMRTLQDAVQARGFTVAHIKTDSIKIPNATQEIIDFCCDYARKYGYIFEHEATYEKMCLVNNAVYIAKYGWAAKKRLIGTWSATGAQFAEPYLFKKLFSKEPIVFDDYKQTKSVTAPAVMYLDFNETLPQGEHNYVHVGRVGSFVPVIDGVGGGLLMRKNGANYTSVVGTKGYRWKESDIVKNLGKEDEIALSYFYRLMDEAISSIKAHSRDEDFEEFMEDYDANEIFNDYPIGFDEIPKEAAIATATVLKGD